MKNPSHDLKLAEHSSAAGIEAREIILGLDFNKFDQISIIENMIKKLEKLTGGKAFHAIYYETFILYFQYVRSTMLCKKYAREGSNEIGNEQKRAEILFNDVVEALRKNEEFKDLGVVGLDNYDAIKALSVLHKTFCEMPLPTLYLYEKKDSWQRNGIVVPKKEGKKQIHSLVRLIVNIDEDPLVSVQRLLPNTLYSIKIIIKGIGWPQNYNKIAVDFVTTCPSDQFSISSFDAVRPPQLNEDAEFELALKGELQFKNVQSFGAENICFMIRCAFRNDTEISPVDSIGTNQLYLRVSNKELLPITSGYKRLDQHIVDLIEKMQSESKTVESELNELFPLLAALTNLVGFYAQSAVFKEVTSLEEKEFQKQILRDLRMKLGEDVQEAPRQAGGITDIRYKGVILELKVERENGSRPDICAKYTKQAAQYQGVESRQVSVVLVLDLTQKSNPPGDVRNDILLVDVPTHGGEDKDKKYPAKAMVFVVNGNIRSPSDYSR